MKETFDKCIDELLDHEGGYVDHPKDPGGATNMGITLETLKRWRKTNVTKQDVKSLTRGEVILIYKSVYWDSVQGDSLPSGLDYAVFDFGVNSGPKRAIIGLQRLLKVADDGVLGPITLKAVSEIKDLKTFINRYQDDRLAFLKALSTFPTFGRGWTARVEKVRKSSLSLVGSTTSVEKEKKGFNLAAMIPLILTILTAVFGLTRK